MNGYYSGINNTYRKDNVNVNSFNNKTNNNNSKYNFEKKLQTLKENSKFIISNLEKNKFANDDSINNLKIFFTSYLDLCNEYKSDKKLINYYFNDQKKQLKDLLHYNQIQRNPRDILVIESMINIIDLKVMRFEEIYNNYLRLNSKDFEKNFQNSDKNLKSQEQYHENEIINKNKDPKITQHTNINNNYEIIAHNLKEKVDEIRGIIQNNWENFPDELKEKIELITIEIEKKLNEK